MISIAGLEIPEHFQEWAFGWDEPAPKPPVRIVVDTEDEARILADRAGGQAFVREVFTSEWFLAPDDDEPLPVAA